MRDTLAGRDPVSYDELEEAEVQEINAVMRQACCRQHAASLVHCGVASVTRCQRTADAGLAQACHKHLVAITFCRAIDREA